MGILATLTLSLSTVRDFTTQMKREVCYGTWSGGANHRR